MLCNVLPRHNWAISTGVIPLERFILSDYRASMLWLSFHCSLSSLMNRVIIYLQFLGSFHTDSPSFGQGGGWAGTTKLLKILCPLFLVVVWHFPGFRASLLSPNAGDFSSGLCHWAGKDLTCGAGRGLREQSREGRADSTEMERRIRKKKTKEHKHSCWFLSGSQLQVNAPDFSSQFLYFFLILWDSCKIQFVSMLCWWVTGLHQ